MSACGGGEFFPELFAGIGGNLTLLMANADAELSPFAAMIIIRGAPPLLHTY